MESDNKIFFILFVLFIIAYTLNQFSRYNNIKSLFLSKSKIGELNAFFSKYFNYFNQLNSSQRKTFIKRAYNLTRTIQIYGRKGFEITPKVKLFVVAAQVQLTFGFRRYDFPIFKKMLIYPGAYRSSATGNMHFGEVNPKGVIVLSWNKLVKGHLIPDDKVNLGLHELSHALMHTIIFTNNHELGLDSYLRDIVRLSKEERKNIVNGHHFFRRYAATNIHEFFAVSVEYFFEAPDKFKSELPQLYQYMVKLLKQDPYRGIYRLNNYKNEKRSYYGYKQRVG